MLERLISYFDKRITIDTQEKVLNDYMKKAQLELIRQAHPYTIRQLKNGRWQTYVKDPTKPTGRKEIKAATQEGIYEALSEYYVTSEKFSDVFCSWIEHMKTYGKTGGTLQRHEQRYKKYIEGSKLDAMPMRKINLLQLEAECNRIVSAYNLPYHEWQQVKTIILGVFKYAVKKGLLTENPMERVEINVRYRQVSKKASDSQVFQSEEYEALLNYLDAKYTETEDLAYLAIKFGFYTGLRVGELSAIQFGDISGRSLHVVREEIGDKTKVNGKWIEKRIVVNHTKTNTDRYVTLLPKALEIINKIKKGHNYSNESFVFTRNGERLTERQLAYVLEKYSAHYGTQMKSTHKIRKTYASRLYASGVPLEHIRKELGHQSLMTTEKYIFNPFTEAETYELMAQAV